MLYIFKRFENFLMRTMLQMEMDRDFKKKGVGVGMGQGWDFIPSPPAVGGIKSSSPTSTQFF